MAAHFGNTVKGRQVDEFSQEMSELVAAQLESRSS